MTAEKLIQIAENEQKVYEAGKAEGIEQGMADVAHLNDELEQILYGTDTGGKSWLDTIYEDVTLTQDVTNVLQLQKKNTDMVTFLVLQQKEMEKVLNHSKMIYVLELIQDLVEKY